MNKKTIAVVGANGKMGQLLCNKLENNFNVIKITKDNNLYDFKNIDLVVDFACAESSVLSSIFCQKNKIPILIASTGQNNSQLKQIISYSNSIPIMICSNLSIGIFLMKKAISSFVQFTNFDVTIYEKHHQLKKDKPSGTALNLKEYIEKLNKNININILSERGGDEVGIHEINFYFGSECLTIKHRAYSKQIFINGALLSISFLIKQKSPGLYNFEKLFDNKIF